MPSLYPGAPAAVTASAKTKKKTTTTTRPAATTAAPAAPPLAPAAPIDWGAVAKAFGVGAGPSTAALTGQARTAAQQDTNYAVGAYRAEQDQATKAAAARAAEINRAAQGAGQYVQSLGLGNQLQQSFSQAAADQGALAAGLSGDLRATVQAAGDKARAAIAQIGGGGLPDTTQQAGNAVYGVGGLLPGNALAAAAPAAVAAANQVGPNILSYGQQQGVGAIQAGRQQAQALEPDITAAIAKQPQLERSYLSDFQTAADRQSKLAFDQAATAVKLQQAGQTAEATRLWRQAELNAKAADRKALATYRAGQLSVAQTKAINDAAYKSNYLGYLDAGLTEKAAHNKALEAVASTKANNDATYKTAYLSHLQAGDTESAAHNAATEAVAQESAQTSRINARTARINARTSQTRAATAAKASGAKTKKTLTPKEITDYVDTWKNGVPTSVTTIGADGVSQTRTVTRGTLNYQPAYRKLRAAGVSDSDARNALNAQYAPGERGRAWLTNEQQAVLRQAGRGAGGGSQVYAPGPRIIRNAQGARLAVLNQRQAAALQQAGMLPAGYATAEGFYVIGQVS